MPLQSGSDRVLKAMRRSYRSEKFLGILDRVRAAMPAAAITTDIIVGFPGETDDDFQATLEVVASLPLRGGVHLPVLDPPRHARGDHARSGAARGRPGALRAAGRPGRSRSAGLRTVQAGRPEVVEVMFAQGEGRKDEATARMSGRAKDNRLVHVRVPEEPELRPRPGDFAEVEITYAAPHHLNADAGLRNLRRAAAACRSRASALQGRQLSIQPRN